MVCVGAINLLIGWGIVAGVAHRNRSAENRRRVLPLVLGVIFVSVACYRTIFVASYPSRLAWFDTMLNSPIVIRCLALFAELAFIGILALVLRSMAPIADARGEPIRGMRVIQALPLVSVGAIATAQFFAFGGLITQYNYLFAIEESLWALAFICLAPVVVARLRRRVPADRRSRIFLIMMAVWCCGYLAFQLGYALPFMYYSHLGDGLGPIVLADALRQAAFDFTATRDFATWGGLGFFVWHSGYFSICSWMVLYSMTVPVRVQGVSK